MLPMKTSASAVILASKPELTPSTAKRLLLKELRADLSERGVARHDMGAPLLVQSFMSLAPANEKTGISSRVWSAKADIARLVRRP